jgi:hypothetical protein
MSEFTSHSSDAESPTRLLVLVHNGPNDNFEIDLLAYTELGATGRGEILHRLRAVFGSHAIRHKLQVRLQRVV